ncbi:MAG: 16S rRNA (adenine(1518)-N(6)/adenine(1519)-N(6))-dimethyltransferase RsmA [Firmicutes bacterium]|nr:16S rRNA (adenine(1518)-N(6)/adenine(1519)-N(6))-dimethyltransferase RsmA [Bacillota bacterium]MDY5676473.1 16S rRNA (adenine(1518)-N(6)/adenine(1519)-N(6))-dimethyltransferase RsmA [Eubacteriales bacterium]
MSNQILKDNNFKFNKAYGQNFIFDKNFLKSIVDGLVSSNDEVLEIGAGAGTLTAMLSSHAKKVVSYEIDKNLQPILSETLKSYNNCKVVFEDIMKVDIKDIEANFEGDYIMVANLPYYITTPIIFKFLENATKLKSMAIMVQYEVAQRLTAKAGTKEYGAITPAIDYRANAKIIKKVGRHMFTPVPNVDSAIVKIDFVKDKYSILATHILDETIKAVFGMRRKTISNNLKSHFGLSQEKIETICKNIGILPTTRGETLDTQMLVNMSNEIFKMKNM